jgi:pilus assembly protein FimV
MSNKINLLLMFLFLMLPVQASALGLGKLKTVSSLNEPFEAEIEILALEAGELDAVKVALASEEAFERVDVDRAYLLSFLRFETNHNEHGKPVIRIFSQRAITEPFLNFLLEVSWPKGQIVREFSVLLDI